MTFFHSSTSKWFYDRIRNRNIFKQSVSLTYDDKSYLSNTLGGISTICIMIFIIIYGILMSIRLFNRTDVQWNQNTINFDGESIEQIYYATDEGNLKFLINIDEIELLFLLEFSLSRFYPQFISEYSKMVEITSFFRKTRDDQNPSPIDPVECNTTSFSDFSDIQGENITKW